jgi:SAM-dependent methyltransferase
MPNPSQIRRYKGLLRHTLDQVLLIDLLRYAVVWVRYFWFAKVLGRLKTLGADGTTHTAVADNTISHNLKGLVDLAVNRSHLLVRPLSVIEALSVDARILSVGPRTEGELMNLIAHGFSWHQLSGLDLISYSPKIQLGDMHSTPYADNSYDGVLLGWVLAYSDEPSSAAQEIIRITRPGGVIAIGVEYSPQSQEQVIAEVGYLPGAKERIESCDQIMAFFGSAVDHVYYQHVVAPNGLASVGALCVIFSIRK